MAATAMILGAGQAHAETAADPVGPAEDAYWSCVKDFAGSLAHNSPLEADAITEQSLRSCDAMLEAFRRVVIDLPLRLSPAEVEARVSLSRDLAGFQVRSTVNGVRSQQAGSQVRRMHEDDVGIWANTGSSEEETADARRPSVLLPASGNLPLP